MRTTMEMLLLEVGIYQVCVDGCLRLPVCHVILLRLSYGDVDVTSFDRIEHEPIARLATSWALARPCYSAYCDKNLGNRKFMQEMSDGFPDTFRKPS